MMIWSCCGVSDQTPWGKKVAVTKELEGPPDCSQHEGDLLMLGTGELVYHVQIAISKVPHIDRQFPGVDETLDVSGHCDL